MRCNNEHQSKMAFAIKLKNYFVWFSCAINFVTIFSVILQLTVEHRGMAMEIVRTVQNNPIEIRNTFNAIESVGEMVLVDEEINSGEIQNLISNGDSVQMPQRKVGVKDGEYLDLTCQLADGSHWSKCEWKHGLKSLSIVRDPNSPR